MLQHLIKFNHVVVSTILQDRENSTFTWYLLYFLLICLRIRILRVSIDVSLFLRILRVSVDVTLLLRILRVSVHTLAVKISSVKSDEMFTFWRNI